MGKGNDNESIAAVVRRASEFPDDDGKGGARVTIPSLFPDFPIPHGEKVVTDEPPPGQERVQGVPSYNFRAHFERFVMGQQLTGRSSDGEFQYEEKDDSPRYEALMNRILDGDAILRWEERKTLNDGTMVISVSYFTPKPKPKKLSDEEEPS
jgi:hypothetical protein